MLSAHVSDALGLAVGNPNPNGGEACREAALGAAPPSERTRSISARAISGVVLGAR